MDFIVRKSIVFYGVLLVGIAFFCAFLVAVERPKNEKDVSSWKTYRNEEYGFEFRYPEGINEPRMQKDGRVCTIGFCVGVSEEKMNFFGLRKKIPFDEKNIFLWYIAVNGRIGYAYTLKDGSSAERILVNNQDEVFTFSSGYRVDRDILATFKFLK